MNRSTLTASLLALLTPAALAGVPLITEDTGTPGQGVWELEVRYVLEIGPAQRESPGGAGRRAFSHDLPSLALNYGVGDSGQLAIGLPVLLLDEPGNEPMYNIGDVSLGFKQRFVEEPDAPVAVSIFPQVTLPTGDAGLGFGLGRPSFTLPIQVGKSIVPDQLDAYLNVGHIWQFRSEDHDFLLVSCGLHWHVVETTTLGFELVHEWVTRGHGRDNTYLGMAIEHRLCDHAALVLGIGRSLDPSATGGVALRVVAGVDFSF